MSKGERSGIEKFASTFASRQVIETTSSKLNPVLEVVEIGNRRMLNSANTNYSYGGLHRVFQKAFKRIDIQKRKIKNVLILGFGAGSVASILQEEYLIECEIRGIEKDGEVLKLAKRFFDVGRFRQVKLIQEDAARYMRMEKKDYDLIVVDVYTDFEVPASCQTDGFISDLERCLEPGGLVIYNKLVYNHEASEQAKVLISKFKKLNGNTRVMKVKENIVNRIIVYEHLSANNT
jgi:spermidine synthase